MEAGHATDLLKGTLTSMPCPTEGETHSLVSSAVHDRKGVTLGQLIPGAVAALHPVGLGAGSCFWWEWLKSKSSNKHIKISNYLRSHKGIHCRYHRDTGGPWLPAVTLSHPFPHLSDIYYAPGPTLGIGNTELGK